ncbi:MULTISPECIES: HypC/HybG/HupF family hydrogenase formation chaperone [Anaerolinea]|uniref:HypC/HybG/HupF family hydrogenase formation chaperone n=1 Tax=Anaerolinea TaxID=233189 RepID=UPI002601D839|nr:HypC/HybG/HupF family hydrogenase formation chaperone [Anaerolinea thermophila]
MCLGIPGKIVEIYQQGGLKMGKIDFGGAIREACLESVPEAEIGQYALVHAGFVITLLSEEEARETLQLLSEISALDEEENL